MLQDPTEASGAVYVFVAMGASHTLLNMFVQPSGPFEVLSETPAVVLCSAALNLKQYASCAQLQLEVEQGMESTEPHYHFDSSVFGDFWVLAAWGLLTPVFVGSVVCPCLGVSERCVQYAAVAAKGAPHATSLQLHLGRAYES